MNNQKIKYCVRRPPTRHTLPPPPEDSLASLRDRVLQYFRPSRPAEALPVGALTLADKLLLFEGRRVWAFELSSLLESQAPQCLFTLMARQSIVSIQVYGTSYPQPFLVMVHRESISVWKLVKEKYEYLCQQDTSQCLLCCFHGQDKLFLCTPSWLYSLQIEKGQLHVLQRIRLKAEVSSAVRIFQGQEPIFAFVSKGSLLISCLVEDHLEEKVLELGQAELRLRSGYQLGSLVVIETSSSILLLQPRLTDYLIINNFELKYSQVKSSRGIFRYDAPDRTVWFVHVMEDRLELYLIQEQAKELVIRDVVHLEDSLKLSLAAMAAWNEELLCVFAEAREQAVEVGVLRLETIPLKEKVNQFLRQKAFSLHEIEQISFKLGMSTEDYYLLAWRASDMEKFAVEKFLLRISSFKKLKEEAKFMMEEYERNGRVCKLDCVLDVYKIGHEIILEETRAKLKPELLKQVIKTAFLVKKLTFLLQVQESLLASEFKQLKARSVVEWALELSRKEDKKLLILFMSYFRITFLLNFQRVIRLVFTPDREDPLVLLPALYFLLPHRIKQQQAQRVKKELWQSDFVEHGLYLWQRPSRLDLNFLYHQRNVMEQLLSADAVCDDINRLIDRTRREKWYQSKLLLRHEGIPLLDKMSEEYQYLCSKGAYFIVLQQVLPALKNEREVLQLLDQLLRLERLDTNFLEYLRIRILTSFLLTAQGKSFTLKQIDQQPNLIFELVLKDRLRYRQFLVEADVQPFYEWLSEDGARVLRLGCMAELTPTELKAFSKAVVDSTLQDFVSMPLSLIRGCEILPPQIMDHLPLLGVFLGSMRVRALREIGPGQLVRELVENYLDPEFNTNQELSLEGTSIWLTHVNNLLTVLLYINEKCLRMEDHEVIRLYFLTLLRFELFYELQTFLELQQPLFLEQNLPDILLEAVQQLFTEVIRTSASITSKEAFLSSAASLVSYDVFAQHGMILVRLAVIFQELEVPLHREAILEAQPQHLLEKHLNLHLEVVDRFPFAKYFQFLEQMGKALPVQHQLLIVNYFLFKAWRHQHPFQQLLNFLIAKDYHALEFLFMRAFEGTKTYKFSERKRVLVWVLRAWDSVSAKVERLKEIEGGQGWLPEEQFAPQSEQSLLRAEKVAEWEGLQEEIDHQLLGYKSSQEIKCFSVGLMFNSDVVTRTLILGEYDQLALEFERLFRTSFWQLSFRRDESCIMIFRILVQQHLQRHIYTLDLESLRYSELFSQRVEDCLRTVIQTQEASALLYYLDRLVILFCAAQGLTYHSPLDHPDRFFSLVKPGLSFELCQLNSIYSFINEEDLESRARAIENKRRSELGSSKDTQFNFHISIHPPTEVNSSVMAQSVTPSHFKEEVGAGRHYGGDKPQPRLEPKPQTSQRKGRRLQRHFLRDEVKVEQDRSQLFNQKLSVSIAALDISTSVRSANLLLNAKSTLRSLYEQQDKVGPFLRQLASSREVAELIVPDSLRVIESLARFDEGFEFKQLIPFSMLSEKEPSQEKAFNKMLQHCKHRLTPANYDYVAQAVDRVNNGSRVHGLRVRFLYLQKVLQILRKQQMRKEQEQQLLDEVIQLLPRLGAQFLMSKVSNIVDQVAPLGLKKRETLQRALLSTFNSFQPRQDNVEGWIKYQIARQKILLLAQ